ncbi:MAG: hypothetical protein QOF78_1792 [Phycisphaerales bacterium]|nr:hypothetical protein [Phycisphaerales bacterium]
MRHALRWLTVAIILACAVSPAHAAAANEIAVAAGDSIQEAIDKAPEGATITLAAGVFPQSVTITKRLTLQGAGWEKTVVGAEKQASLTQKDKDEFFAALEATSNKEERARIAIAFATGQAKPTLVVKNAKDVVLRGIKLRGPPSGSADGGLTAESLLTFDNAAGTISGCAVVGPFMNGITVLGGSDVKIEKSLVAAMWGTGVAVAQRAKLHMSESDIRNCYHRCVTLSSDDATIEKCRISGSAWHGIRYDHCSPKILGNHIFANARSGIYASGRSAASVRGNVFWKNEMDAMSCWFDNSDTVESNTIAGNLREGISVLGGSKTNLSRNVFVDNPVAVLCSKIASRGQTPQDAPVGNPTIEKNYFFRNAKDHVITEAVSPAPPGNETTDPKVGGPSENFALAADSPARKANAGAADPIPFASPFAIQPEEKSIIPDSETRNYSKWKKLAAAR